MGSHKQPNFVKGEGLGAVLLGVPQNISFYESVSTTFLPIVTCCIISIIQFCSLALTSYTAGVLLRILGRPGGILTVIFNSAYKYEA